MEKWSVYRHVFPNGFVYIGITSQDPKVRWNNGFGYKTHEKLFKEIVKYGWDNIRHEVIIEGLTETEAKNIEKDLIKKTINVLNTVHAHTESEEKSLEELSEKIRWFIAAYDDVWLENFRVNGQLPFDVAIKNGDVVATYYSMESGKVKTSTAKVKIPPDVNSFTKLWAFLNSINAFGCKNKLTFAQ